MRINAVDQGTRNFDKKTYYFHSMWSTKEEAKYVVKQLRIMGDFARMARVGYAYNVYFRRN